MCSVCQTPYTEQDIVILNGSDNDIDLMRTRMELRVARIKAEKKDKKKVKAAETIIKEEPGTSLAATSKLPGSSKPKSLLTIKPSIPAKKRQILLDTLSSDPNAKKVKKDYTVASDPKATEVYKSLFTSHDSEKNQERAHWVTFNPHYY